MLIKTYGVCNIKIFYNKIMVWGSYVAVLFVYISLILPGRKPRVRSKRYASEKKSFKIYNENLAKLCISAFCASDTCAHQHKQICET